jgi:hypothetical protein
MIENDFGGDISTVTMELLDEAILPVNGQSFLATYRKLIIALAS